MRDGKKTVRMVPENPGRAVRSGPSSSRMTYHDTPQATAAEEWSIWTFSAKPMREAQLRRGFSEQCAAKPLNPQRLATTGKSCRMRPLRLLVSVLIGLGHRLWSTVWLVISGHLSGITKWLAQQVLLSGRCRPDIGQPELGLSRPAG